MADLNDSHQYYDDFYEEGYTAGEFEEDLTESEKARLTRLKIGFELLRESTKEESDNIWFLNRIRIDYGLSLSTVMAFASERLVDMFSVGEIYLSPLFKDKQEKENYIVKKLQQYDKANGKILKFDERLILIKVYNIPSDYARLIVKYMYTKNDYERLPLKSKIGSLFEKINYKLNQTKYISPDLVEHYKKLYNDVINGKRANNLKWLMNLNKKRAMSFADERIDLYQEDKVMTINDENLVILHNISLIRRILQKENINLNDKEELDAAFEGLNNYVIIASNEYKASKEFDFNK